MFRNIDLNEISDGNRYHANDLVRADCGGCQGCSACCHGMGDTILLDPYDMDQLRKGSGYSPEELFHQAVELSVVDGIILPHLKMTADHDCCPFLSDEGRCTIHSFRPGFCRLFPLGRIYENGSFSYFLQTNECKKIHRSKVRIKKWLGIPDLSRYETFCMQLALSIKRSSGTYCPYFRRIVSKTDIHVYSSNVFPHPVSQR